MDAVTGLRDEQDWLPQAGVHQAGRGAVVREPQAAEPARSQKEQVQTDAMAGRAERKQRAFVRLELESAPRRVRLAEPQSWRRREPELPEEQEARKPPQARPEVLRDDDERRGKLLPWPAFPPALRIPRQRQCQLVPEWRGEP